MPHQRPNLLCISAYQFEQLLNDLTEMTKDLVEQLRAEIPSANLRMFCPKILTRQTCNTDASRAVWGHLHSLKEGWVMQKQPKQSNSHNHIGRKKKDVCDVCVMFVYAYCFMRQKFQASRIVGIFMPLVDEHRLV